MESSERTGLYVGGALSVAVIGFVLYNVLEKIHIFDDSNTPPKTKKILKWSLAGFFLVLAGFFFVYAATASDKKTPIPCKTVLTSDGDFVCIATAYFSSACGGAYGMEVQYTAPASGPYTFSTCGTSGLLAFTNYTCAESCPASNSRRRETAPGTEIVLDLLANQTLQFLVLSKETNTAVQVAISDPFTPTTPAPATPAPATPAPTPATPPSPTPAPVPTPTLPPLSEEWKWGTTTQFGSGDGNWPGSIPGLNLCNAIENRPDTMGAAIPWNFICGLYGSRTNYIQAIIDSANEVNTNTTPCYEIQPIRKYGSSNPLQGCTDNDCDDTNSSDIVATFTNGTDTYPYPSYLIIPYEGCGGNRGWRDGFGNLQNTDVINDCSKVFDLVGDCQAVTVESSNDTTCDIANYMANKNWNSSSYADANFSKLNLFSPGAGIETKYGANASAYAAAHDNVLNWCTGENMHFDIALTNPLWTLINSINNSIATTTGSTNIMVRWKPARCSLKGKFDPTSEAIAYAGGYQTAEQCFNPDGTNVTASNTTCPDTDSYCGSNTSSCSNDPRLFCCCPNGHGRFVRNASLGIENGLVRGKCCTDETGNDCQDSTAQPEGLCAPGYVYMNNATDCTTTTASCIWGIEHAGTGFCGRAINVTSKGQCTSLPHNNFCENKYVPPAITCSATTRIDNCTTCPACCFIGAVLSSGCRAYKWNATSVECEGWSGDLCPGTADDQGKPATPGTAFDGPSDYPAGFIQKSNATAIKDYLTANEIANCDYKYNVSSRVPWGEMAAAWNYSAAPEDCAAALIIASGETYCNTEGCINSPNGGIWQVTTDPGNVDCTDNAENLCCHISFVRADIYMNTSYNYGCIGHFAEGYDGLNYVTEDHSGKGLNGTQPNFIGPFCQVGRKACNVDDAAFCKTSEPNEQGVEGDQWGGGSTWYHSDPPGTEQFPFPFYYYARMLNIFNSSCDVMHGNENGCFCGQFTPGESDSNLMECYINNIVKPAVSKANELCNLA